MHVDRARFLLLTSALFAACKEGEPPPSAPIVIPPQPPAPPETAKPEPPPIVDAGVKAPVVVAQDGDDEEPYEPWEGAADVPMAKSVHAQACEASDNQKGAVQCALKAPPGPACESFASTRSECAKLRSWLVPRAAEKTAQCLQQKSGKQDICNFNIGPACFVAALSSVCLDDSARNEADCKKVMSACGSVEKKYRHMNTSACRAALSAIVPGRRGKFVTCAAESCDLVPCYYAAGS
jgi:hypothetical protein